jgi:hypothetical protein
MASKTNLVRASRDGDQFHYLWAARRCLKLLSSNSDLIAISIEGPSPLEHAGGAPTTDGEEVIDIAEYFGSEELKNARLVQYVQLKHSTVRTTEPWTASGLGKTITGFSKRYKKLLAAFPSDVLASKIQFWFVTNRPIGANFIDAIADAAAKAQPRHPSELTKLELFTHLKGDALADFCSLLHLEGSQDGYWDQRNILHQDVSGYLPQGDVDGPLKLKELVTRKALSESGVSPTITKMDVLRALNTNESLLFPAPCQVERLEAPIPRDQELHILKEIVDSSKPMIVHASGGVGKSVFATRIAAGLPSGSTCLLYDCFGNGQYRNASGYRHRHRDALVQIANELSAMGLCHLLIPTQLADTKAYVQSFVHRVSQAATQIRHSNPAALLCIVVDAADNAQMAAEEVGEARSFVRDIIRESMPENVRLVFLCRSHRQHHLDPPVDVVRLELEPFSRDETAAFLRQRFSNATDIDITEFHRLSSHNPRVQALALSSNNSLTEMLRLLGPNPTTVEDTIGALLEAAINKLKDSSAGPEKAQIERVCIGLAALRPLIPISILSKISSVDESAIRSLATDLGRPLLVSGEAIQFFDEPAETWFREKFKPSAEAMSTFIANLTPLAKSSAYVASVLPQLMLEAGKFSDLVALALTSAALPETSPLEKRDVELQRLQFALKAGLRSKRYLEAAKLALKAGGVTAGDDRQRKLLQENTDLAATFIETDLIQEIVSRRTFGSGWLGSHHAYEAALLSGRIELVGDARSRLRIAYEWLRNWSRLTTKERKDEEVSDQDIVELTIAHINIHGAANAAHELGRWTPREVSFRVGRIVTRRLIDHGRFKHVDEFAGAAGKNLCLVLAILVELRAVQRVPPSKVTKRAFQLVTKKRIILKESHAWNERDTVIEAVTALVEAALIQGACSSIQAAALLSEYLPSEPARALSPRFSKSRFPILRAYCLRAVLQGQVLKLRDLAHAELRVEMDKKNQHATSRELQEFNEDIGALLPWFQLWAATLLGHVNKETLDNQFALTRKASSSAGKMYHRDDYHTSNEIALLWLDVLHKLDVSDPQYFVDFTQWKDNLKRPLFTTTLTALARLCCQREETKASAIKFAVEAFQITKDERSDAENKVQGYIDATRSILMTSKLDAKAFFNEAVEVADKIGDENLARWTAILDLAEKAYRADRPSPEVAYKFSRCAELTYDYVARDKHFDWEATIAALCDLCPSSALAILSRWRDRGFGWSERILPLAIARLIDRRALDARDALPLVGFQAEWSHDQLLDDALSSCTSASEKEAVAAHIYRYVRIEGGDFSKLNDVLLRHDVLIAELSDVLAFKEIETVAKPQINVEKPTHDQNSYAKPERDWNFIFIDCDIDKAHGLSQCYAAFKKSGSPFEHGQFFEECIRRLAVGTEPAFIEAVGKVPEFELYEFRVFLERIPDAWKDRPAITKAIALTLNAFCRRYCMGISKNRIYEVLPFKLACSLAGIEEVEIVDVVLDAVGEATDLAAAPRLFSLVGLLAIKLSEDEALEALKFGLGLFDPLLEDKDGDGPWSNKLLPPTDVRASLAGYIWAAMASPKSVIRWEGAHVVLGLTALDRTDILAHLMQGAGDKKGGPFVDSKLPFYQFHALQWLLIGIARAANEYPTILIPWAAQIIDLALKDQPHVLLRLFAARAGIALIDGGVLADNDHLRERLSRINMSALPVAETKSYERINRPIASKTSRTDDDRFYFGIDIGPYWYAPLGSVFALSQDKIESEALNVIRKDLGISAKGRWDADERWQRKLYEEGHAHHSHGSYPREDDLHFYLSYHAMMIVAGKRLLDTQTHRSPEYGAEDEFADWLERHDLSRDDGRWLSDRRDPTPLERSAWRNLGKDYERWGVLDATDFDEALHSGNTLNIWGGWTEADSDREQSVHVSSALVLPDKSSALLRALSTAKNIYDYAIPSAESDMEIDKSGFSLKGWIVDNYRDHGIDDQDRWAGNVNFPPPGPAGEVIELMNLETDLDRRIWKGSGGETVMISQVWGHFDEAKRNESGNPRRGNRLQAPLKFITAILKKLNRDLIVEVKIDRKRRYRAYESSVENDKGRVPTKAKIYLLRSDGRIDTL